MSLAEKTKLRYLLSPWRAFRDAGTGEYVTRLYALAHPLTTVSERRERRRSRP